MISTSDIVILVVASGALAVGVYRWHENTQDVSAITIPASSQSNTVTIAEQPKPVLVTKTIAEPTPINEIVVSEEATAAVVNQKLGTYTVENGDYLGKIANRLDTEVQTLRELNGIEGSYLEVGQELLYPL